MAEQEKNLFRIGDVVTLKMNPEFRAIIQYFGKPKGNGMDYESIKCLEKDHPFLWAHISRLEDDGKIQTLNVPVVHLRSSEEGGI